MNVLVMASFLIHLNRHAASVSRNDGRASASGFSWNEVEADIRVYAGTSTASTFHFRRLDGSSLSLSLSFSLFLYGPGLVLRSEQTERRKRERSRRRWKVNNDDDNDDDNDDNSNDGDNESV